MLAKLESNPLHIIEMFAKSPRLDVSETLREGYLQLYGLAGKETAHEFRPEIWFLILE